MKFADIPAEVVQVGPIKSRGPVRLTSLADGSVLKVMSVRSEKFHKRGDPDGSTNGERFLLKSKGGDEFAISPNFHAQLVKALEYAAKHGKTDEEKGEVEITLGSVTTGKGDKALTRRILK